MTRTAVILIAAPYAIRGVEAQTVLVKVSHLWGQLVEETGREPMPARTVMPDRRAIGIHGCKQTHEVGQVQTKKSGKFQFSRTPGGSYCIVAVAEGRQHKTAVEYTAGKQSRECSGKPVCDSKEWQFHSDDTY